MQIDSRGHILGEGNSHKIENYQLHEDKSSMKYGAIEHSIAIAKHLMANISFISPGKSQTLNQESKTFRK